MASLAPFGFGIVGVGMIADYHARAIAEVSGAKLMGVAARSEEKAAAFATKHGAVFATASVGDLLARPDIDIVCITTPSGAHLEPAVLAAKAGKHIVIEKPLEINLERVDELLNAASAANVKVAAIFQSRFGEGARKVKAVIDSGRLGRLVLGSVYFKWLRKAEYYKDSWHGTLALDGGGVLMNQGSHGIDLLQWFAGMPEEVFAWTTRRVHTDIEAEDTGCATLRFQGGALGCIEGTTAAFPGWQRRIEICGENGSVALEDDRISKWDFREPIPGDEGVVTAGGNDQMRTGASAPNQISHHGHRLQIQDMVDALRENRPLAIDGREARKAVTLICGLYESARLGRAVRL